MPIVLTEFLEAARRECHRKHSGHQHPIALAIALFVWEEQFTPITWPDMLPCWAGGAPMLMAIRAWGYLCLPMCLPVHGTPIVLICPRDVN